MIRTLEKLNLRPHEIRIVVGVALIVFVLLNVWFVFPLFGQWGKTQRDIRTAKEDYVKFQREIGRVEGASGYKARLAELEDEGATILPEEYAIQLRRTIQTTASANGIVAQSLTSVRGAGASTPADLFEEESISMSFNNVTEQQLVDFLYELSVGRSLIRVRDMTLNPDPTKTKLQGTLTLTASFQKNSLTKRPAATASAN